MAAPNIVNVATITGKNFRVPLTSTSAIVLINNPAGSGKAMLVTLIRGTNVDGTTPCDLSVNVYSQDDLGGTATPIASTIAVPADAALDITDKTTSFWLEEDQSVGAQASAANDITMFGTYVEIS